jgi:hypothetical protein
MASYLHIHADGVPEWSLAFVAAAAKYQNERRGRAKGMNQHGAGASGSMA